MRIKLLSLFCGAVLGLSFSAAADVNGDMNNFFNKLGFASNTSQPQVWQGQAAGYASGGSLYARTQVKTIQLVSMTLPDINAGCGGIDAYLGSFSFINSEQLQRFATAAQAALDAGLGVNAGHDLNRDNLTDFARAVPGLQEVSIGHALIADALELGYAATVEAYLQCLRAAGRHA